MSEATLICEDNYPHPQAETLLNQAFGDQRAARNVYALRASSPVTDLCWGIEKSSNLIALIRYWEVCLQCETAGHEIQGRYLLLGPLGVMPDETGKGYGVKLIQHTLSLAEKLSDRFDYRAILVSGERGYYQKLGFQPISIISPHNTPPNDWQIYYSHSQAEIFTPQQSFSLQPLSVA